MYTDSNILLEVTDPADPEVCRTDMTGCKEEGRRRKGGKEEGKGGDESSVSFLIFLLLYK